MAEHASDEWPRLRLGGTLAGIALLYGGVAFALLWAGIAAGRCP